jgi:hypothetical protein
MPVMPFGPPVNLPVDQHDADDLAEAQRDDREIVAAQAQHREAEQHAEEGGQGCRRAAGRCQKDRSKLRRQQRVGIGADRVEGDVAEIEQAGEADDDVQAPAEHDVGQHQVSITRRIDDRSRVGSQRSSGRQPIQRDALDRRVSGGRRRPPPRSRAAARQHQPADRQHDGGSAIQLTMREGPQGAPPWLASPSDTSIQTALPAIAARRAAGRPSAASPRR